MALTFAHVAAIVAGIAICTTGLILPSTSKGLLKGVAAAITLAITAALLITAARALG